MGDWVRHRARSDPDKTALIDAATGRSWTYGELDMAVQGVTQWLKRNGVDRGERVATRLPRSPLHIQILWGILRAGGVVVPMDPSEPEDKLATLLDQADTTVLVGDPNLGPGQSQQFDELDLTMLTTDAIPEATDKAKPSTPEYDIHEGDSSEPASTIRSHDQDGWLDTTRFVMFTSGTTGDSNGVRLTPRNIATSAAASAFRLGVSPVDRWLLTLPMYHMGGLSIPLRSAIYGTTVVVEREFEAEETLETMHDYDITGISLVPTMLKRLLDAGRWPESLRFALVGGAPTPPSLARDALHRGVPLYTTYGMTETASQIATATPQILETDPETVGRPLRTASVHILDSDGTELPEGVTGEIAVSGPIVSPGYIEETDTRDAEDPFRTGDIGYLDEDGLLYVTGRADDQIITGGENVHPSEIREAIIALQGVEDAAVVGIPDEEWGERIAAAVVLTASGSGTGTLEEKLRENLADHKVPKTMVEVESIPRTASGTVDRNAVRERLRGTEE